jgi:predicted outer membrane repeat protein
VYVASGGMLNLNGGMVIFNFAPLGGGIANYGTCTIQANSDSGDAVAQYLDSEENINSDHSSFGNAVAFRNNSASNAGGSIYTESELIINGGESSFDKFTGKGVIFVANKATKSGGAIYVAGGTTKINTGVFGFVNSSEKAINYTDTESSENSDDANSGGAIGVNGGELYVGNSESSKIDFNGNYSVNGGAIAVLSGKVELGNNKVKFINNEAHNGNGGAVYVKRGTVSIDATFVSNKASNGGAVATCDGTTTFAGGSMQSHIATYNDESKPISNGGSVYVGGGEFIMTGGLIGKEFGEKETPSVATGDSRSNRATNGGGVYVASGGTFTMQGESSTICYNYATTNGGGVYVASGGTFNLINGKIIYNGAANGGGIYVDGGNATDHKDGVGSKSYAISGNNASEGGGVYLKGSVNWNFTANDSAHVISNNTASTKGGGLYIAEGSSDVTINSYFSGNKITDIDKDHHGGAIYADAKFSFTGQIFGNGKTEQVAYNGGGIYVSSNAGNSSIGGNIQNCLAQDGGAVYAKSSITFTGTATGNKASNGGALYLAKGGTVAAGAIIGGSADDKNEATTAGGGVYSGSTLTVNGKISNNEATGNGGGAYVSGALSMSGNSARITNNTAKAIGGGAYINGNLTMTGGAIISNNSGAISTYSKNYSYVNYSSSLTNGVYIEGNAISVKITGGSQLCAEGTSNASNHFALIVTGSLSSLVLNSGNSLLGAVWFGNHTLDTTLVSKGYINGNVNIYPQSYLKYYNKMACRAEVIQYRIKWRYKYIWILWIGDIEEWRWSQWHNESFTHETMITCRGSDEVVNVNVGFFNCEEKSGQERSGGIRGWFDYMFTYYYAEDYSPVATIANWGGKTSTDWSYPSNDYERKYTGSSGYGFRGEYSRWTRNFEDKVPGYSWWPVD